MPSSSHVDQNSYNLQSNSRFIFDIPINQILGERANLKNFSLNVFSFDTSEISSGINNIKYNGYEFQIPNGIRIEDKMVNIRFNVSENLLQYAALLEWINRLTAMSMIENAPNFEKLMVTSKLWFPDAMLKTGIFMLYEKMFINRLGGLSFDQSAQDNEHLKCDASFRFFKFTLDIEKILGPAQN